MATKTITIDVEAYKQLKSVQQAEESLRAKQSIRGAYTRRAAGGAKPHERSVSLSRVNRVAHWP